MIDIKVIKAARWSTAWTCDECDGLLNTHDVFAVINMYPGRNRICKSCFVPICNKFKLTLLLSAFT